MSSYTPDRYLFPTSLDELGLRLGLQRLDGEEIDDYRNRLLLQLRKPPGPSWESFSGSTSRMVGMQDLRVFQIDLVLNPDGTSVATYPFVEVSSSMLRVWDNYESAPVLELDIFHHGDGYFLRDVYTQLSALPFLTISILEPDCEFLKSSFLQIGKSLGYAHGEFLNRTQCTRLKNGFIVSINFSRYDRLKTLVASADAIVESGDYYVDRTNGVVFSYDIQDGAAFYEYLKFPYYLWWQPVRGYPLNDPDIDVILKETLIGDDTGEEERVLLNHTGAGFLNELLSAAPLHWGE
jgi:hypothetical protein